MDEHCQPLSSAKGMDMCVCVCRAKMVKYISKHCAPELAYTTGSWERRPSQENQIAHGPGR
jgi:hypothetical protein